LVAYDHFSQFRVAEEKYAEVQRLSDDLKVKKEPPRGVLEFRAGWHQFLRGELAPGGRLIVRYDLSRLESSQGRWWLNGLRAYVRFHPGGRLYDVKAFATSMLYRPPMFVWFELTVPLNAERVELWFHTEADEEYRVYDSCYDQNYWFEVERAGSDAHADAEVRPRADATGNGRIIKLNGASVFQFERYDKEGDEAVRVVQTFLTAEVRAADSDDANVWLDLHVFDEQYELIRAETVSLHRLVAGLFKLVYQIDTRSPSLAQIRPRPDVKLFEFRIYCRHGGQTYTDHVLHHYPL
jgi:hypothetical protein